MSDNYFPALTPYNFTVTLRPYGDDPNAGIVQIDPVARYGYWEFKDGCEGGGLWFESTEDGLMLADFDGYYDLPLQVYRALTEAGFKLDEFMGTDTLDNVTICLSEHEDGFIARYLEDGRTIWSELYDRVEDARIAYADYAAAGKYSEDLGAQ